MGRQRGPVRGRGVAAGAAALGAASLLFAGCSSSDGLGSAVGSADAQAFVAGDGSVATVPAGSRRPAPDMTATTLDGKPFSLADMHGRVVVINVWASWCAPCRSEAAALREVYEKTDRKDVAFVGLATRDSAATASAFAERFGLRYQHVLDDDGRLQLAFRDSLPPAAIPATIVIDRSGRVAGRVLGEVTAATLRGLIEPLVTERGEA